jgi:RimJ/RimL family protein N-acetyltransferase
VTVNRILLDIPITVITPRLILRVPHAGDSIAVHDAILDGYEDYIQWLNWPNQPPTVNEVEEQCRRHHAEFILRQDMRYLICDKTSGTILGRCAFPAQLTVWAIPQFGISYFVRRSSRHQGIATEASLSLTRLAFEFMNARKIEIHVDAENKASRAIPEALNFKLEAAKRGGWPRYDGTLGEFLSFAMFDLKELPSLELQFKQE